VTLVVGDDLDNAPTGDTDTGVGGSQVNTDHSSIFWMCLLGADSGRGEGEEGKEGEKKDREGRKDSARLARRKWMTRHSGPGRS